jgi:PAS domain S-box-containing protein
LARAVSTIRSARSATSAEAKLTLTEFLLRSGDLFECAQRAVEWMGEHTGVKHAMCVAFDVDPGRLVGVAAYGLSPIEVRDYELDTEEKDNPLIAALDRNEPITFRPNGSGGPHPVTPFGSRPYTAYPLRGDTKEDDDRVGILFFTQTPGIDEDALRWVADLLSHKVARLRVMRRMRKLERERALLHGIIDAVPDPIMLTDAEGRLLIANRRAEALFAATEGESEGRRRAVALNNMLFSSAMSQRNMDEAESTRREMPLVDPNEGSDLLFERITTGVHDPREGVGYASILRNVTDLRRATEEIEENYRRLRIAEAHVRAERDRLDLIIDSVADPILVTDPAGNIVMMNSPAEQLFTASSHEGNPEAQRVVQANDAHFSSFVSNLFFAADELRYRGEVALIDPMSSESMPVEAIAGKILSEHGEVTAVVTILHDRREAIEKARLYEQLKRASGELEEKVREATAELVQQNELLQRQRLEVEQASALKSQFLANMSHEFRTPLNAILGYTSMLLQGMAGQLNPQQQKMLGRVDSNGKNLLSIINDILDISRIEAGKMPLRLTEFRIQDLVAEVVAEVEPIIARSKVAVTTTIDREVPAISSDRQKVKQIVLNLLTNALKFTPQGSISVGCTLDRATRKVAVVVADTGIGIAEDDQPKIFEDFRQADNSPTRQYGGAGLGLAICRRLATMLEGQITLASQIGEGSTFTLVLPLRPRRR